MKIYSPTNTLDLPKNITWQFDKALNLQALIFNQQAFVESSTTAFWKNFVPDVFNLTTCKSFGLSIWGLALGVSRPSYNSQETCVVSGAGTSGANGTYNFAFYDVNDYDQLQRPYYNKATNIPTDNLNQDNVGFQNYYLYPSGGNTANRWVIKRETVISNQAGIYFSNEEILYTNTSASVTVPASGWGFTLLTGIPSTVGIDCTPSGLNADVVWHDSGAVNSGKIVWHDPTDTYAFWYNGTEWFVTVIADVGGTPTNYFKFVEIV